jgi:pyridoxamine 5'-phosphate oxidase family protein
VKATSSPLALNLKSGLWLDLSAFTDGQLAYLNGGHRLARIATVGADGTPHVVPVGWTYNSETDTIDVGGRNFAASKKYRDVTRNGRAAIVVDDVVPPWKPRGVEVRGRAEVIAEPVPLIRIHPDRIVSWGIEHQA